MDTLFLSRIQFALTAGFHFLFPPLTIGLGLMLVLMEGLYLKTKNPVYEQMTKFWVKMFGLIFVMGVATGIVLEFEFGMNWSRYARYVGDVFGSVLAAEGVLAFFLESCFLGVLLFGWDRVSPKMHFFSTIMVSFGSMLSSVWIIVANSWMHTPAGYHRVGEGAYARAEIIDFWAMVFNPSVLDRLSHVLVGAIQTGSFAVLAIGAYYLLKKKHVEFAKATVKIALIVAAVSSCLQLATGHASASGVSVNQPLKLATMEGHYEKDAPATLYMFGWVDEKNERVIGIGIPGMVGILVCGDPNAKYKGLNSFPKEDWPPVNFVFQTYHAMVGIGMMLIAISLFGCFLLWRGTIFEKRWLLFFLVLAGFAPQIANQLGWITAEVGRQPWIVYNVLRTSEAVSKTIAPEHVWASIVMFTLIYTILTGMFLYLFVKKIKQGPAEIK